MTAPAPFPAESAVRLAYARLRAATLGVQEARRAYLDELQARYAAHLRDLEARLAAARRQARAEEEAALAAAAVET